MAPERAIRLKEPEDIASSLLSRLTAERVEWDANPAPAILLVADGDLTVPSLSAALKSEPYRVLETRSGEEAARVLESERVNLIILDLSQPQETRSAVSRCLQQNRAIGTVPVLLLTSVAELDNDNVAPAGNLDEFLLRPIHPALLRSRVRGMLHNQAAAERLREAESVLFALAQAIEHRDKYTGGHCQRLAMFSISIGIALGLDTRELRALYRGGYLHDIGKVSIPDIILFRQGALSEQEWNIMRSHPIKGEEICRPQRSLAAVLPIIRSHHERWDGTGYPDGLRGEEIPLGARVLQIADVYDALTTARPYKPAYSPDQALEILHQEGECGWRDRSLVALFRQLHHKIIPRIQDNGCGVSSPDFEAMQQALLNLHRELAD